MNTRTLCEIAETRGDNMKKIWTDFNGPNPNRLRISSFDMEYFDLSDGEIVIIYTEDIQVEARIIYDDEQSSWCGELVGEVFTVTKEIEEAREDGFRNGRLFGSWTERDNLIRRMRALKMDPKKIEEITGVPRAEIIKRY
ncbi:hypothetical protein [Cohnella sp. WQ 127256]|uniref:hypothetical protein n=1 Tax=Cohnella sp. WQ 127256 TaxID=2938790 RepID=UPI002119584B|nr:hypothetical protein [Cohnella sp. WQ 127256]